jgi:hypothetical protein
VTRNQANALSQALAARQIGHTLTFAYDGAGAESVNASLDPSLTYSGDQLDALATYCAGHNLTLSVVVDKMGVV